MTLKKETLDEATQARDTLLDLEHQADRARVDYHHMIRRLHADGGSLREIAEALGLSHQRVHQIVDHGPDGDRGRGRGPGGPGRHRGPGHRRGEGHPGGPGGPDSMHRLRRRIAKFASFGRFAHELRGAVLAAVESAEELGHPQVGSEHLLIGVVSAPQDDPAVTALAGLGVDRDAVVAAVKDRLATTGAESRRRPFTRAARRVLEGTLRIADEAGDSSLTVSHLLRALVADDGDAAEILAELGAPATAITAALDEQ